MSIYVKMYLSLITIGLVSLAIRYPTVVVPVYVFIATVLLASRISSKKREQRYKDAFNSVFAIAESVPEYEQSYSYGYPFFTLTFQEKADCDQYLASDRSTMFLSKIDELCRSTGSNKRPFNVQEAVFVTYKAKLEPLNNEA